MAERRPFYPGLHRIPDLDMNKGSRRHVARTRGYYHGYGPNVIAPVEDLHGDDAQERLIELGSQGIQAVFLEDRAGYIKKESKEKANGPLDLACNFYRHGH